ncbi:MAG: hypothetical protein Q4D29_08165 [Lachnospiraceae bacterium]|nr:hypothetical protein [Lachnospiraceae bacterium]
MQDVTVSALKIAYLRECLSRYNGSTGYLMLFFAMLLFIIVKGSEKEKKIFVPMSVLSVATVYNPVFPHMITLFTKIDSEYYRFFWITPVVILVPYIMTKLVIMLMDGKIKYRKTVIVLLVLAILLSSGSVFNSGMRIAENKYKIPDELIEISEIIHNDSDKEYPKAFLEFEYNMQMRQYDPKMLLTIDREDYLYAVSKEYTTEMVDSDEKPQYRLLAGLVRYQKVNNEKLVEALEMTDTEYVVLTTGSTMIPILEDLGLEEVATTKGHTILKYNQKEIVPFELVDYSGCYVEGL